MSVRRGVLLWLALFAVYASTLGLNATRGEEYGPAEAHTLLTAESIVSDGDADLRDEYHTRAWRRWYGGRLRPEGQLTKGRLNEPHGVGLALALAPAYAIAGPRAAELEIAAFMALAFVLAAALARRLAPDPWATGAALLVALSPPVIAYSTAIYAEPLAAALLCAAALLALRARGTPRVRSAALAALALAALPWLGPKYLPAAAVVGVALAGWLLRRRRGLAALVAGEIAFTSLVVYVSINNSFFGGLTPFAASRPGHPPTGAGSAGDYLHRPQRLVALWLDRDVGVLRWSPIVLLAALGVWQLWRARRERLARALPSLADEQSAGLLVACILLAQVLAAALLAPTLFGPWFAGRQLIAALPFAAALAALGLRRAPRLGVVLGALTIAGSVWLYAALRFGSDHLIDPRTRAPLGPVADLLPRYASGTQVWPDVVTALAAAGLVALATWELVLRPRRDARIGAETLRAA
jgi:hypothetical protein